MTAADTAIAERPATMLARPVISGTLGAELAPATRAGEVILLRWIDHDEIPVEHRTFVRWHVDRVAGLLGLGFVEVLWFGPALGGRGDFPFMAQRAGELPAGVTPGSGYAPMAIGLNASLRGAQLVAAVIAHECRHVAQDVLRSVVAGEDWAERDAERFATSYLAGIE